MRRTARLVDAHQTGLGQVAEQHAYDGQRQVGVRGELDDRPGAAARQVEQGGRGVIDTGPPRVRSPGP